MDKSEINIRLHGIELVASLLNQQPSDAFEGTNYNFNLRVEPRIDVEKKLIISLVKIDITEFNKEYLLYSITVAIGVEIIDFENVIKTNENGVLIIPPQLDGIIKTVSISTTRGIIFSELRGTYLHSAVLPIIFQQPIVDDTDK